MDTKYTASASASIDKNSMDPDLSCLPGAEASTPFNLNWRNGYGINNHKKKLKNIYKLDIEKAIKYISKNQAQLEKNNYVVTGWGKLGGFWVEFITTASESVNNTSAKQEWKNLLDFLTRSKKDRWGIDIEEDEVKNVV